jgi:hypothetical protein
MYRNEAFIPPELVLGTANLCNQYGRNNTGFIDKSQTFDILACAKSLGINWLDCSVQYNNLDVIQEWQDTEEPFNVIAKVVSPDDISRVDEVIGKKEGFYLAHGAQYYQACKGEVDGASLYDPVELLDRLAPFHDIIAVEAPCNIFDVRWIPTFAAFYQQIYFIIRSVFLHGDLFLKTDPLAALSFNMVKSLPVDYVIVGADSPAQLTSIVKMPQYTVDYTKLAQGETWLTTT